MRYIYIYIEREREREREREMKNNFRNFLIFRENKLYIIPQLQSNHIFPHIA